MIVYRVQGLKEVLDGFNEFTVNQAPFAVAKALTMTVKNAQANLTEHIKTTFDKPTAFTQRAMAITPATKQTLRASVFVKEAQAQYLFPQMTGGARGFKTFEEKFKTPSGMGFIMPGQAAEKNQYGNISKAKLLKIARDVNTSGNAKRFFSGKPKGGKHPAGVYTRVNNNTSIAPLLIFATNAQYEKRFKFSEIAQDTVDKQFEQNLQAAWSAAIKTKK
jgi:hypothetical protein